MYLPDSFYNRCEVKIPRDFILDMSNKYDLPVYVTLCLAYAPFCKEPFSVKRVLELSRMFRSIAARNKSMTKTALSLLRLRDLGYLQIIYCNGISIEQDMTKSKFLFRFVQNKTHDGYLSIKAGECDSVLDIMHAMPASECRCSLCTLFHIYCLFRMNSYFWQRTYELQYPAWVGHLSEIYRPLGVTQKTMTDAVKVLGKNNVFSVCYGSTAENFTERQKTIVIFNKAITDQSINSVIHQVKERYNKSNTLNGSWYPPNSTVANSASKGVINKVQ